MLIVEVQNSQQLIEVGAHRERNCSEVVEVVGNDRGLLSRDQVVLVVLLGEAVVGLLYDEGNEEMESEEDDQGDQQK